MRKIGVYSGKVFLGECGKKTDLLNIDGKPLYVGDIVINLAQHKYGSPDLTSETCYCMSVVVENKTNDKLNKKYFVMGLSSVDINNHNIDNYEYKQGKTEWVIKRVKSFENVLDGEKWFDFGFNYKFI